jgi:hypothetical protein
MKSVPLTSGYKALLITLTKNESLRTNGSPLRRPKYHLRRTKQWSRFRRQARLCNETPKGGMKRSGRLNRIGKNPNQRELQLAQTAVNKMVRETGPSLISRWSTRSSKP